MSSYVVEAVRGPLASVRCGTDARLRRFDRLRTSAGIGATVALCDGQRLWAILDADDEQLGPGAVLRPGEPEVVPVEPERFVELSLALADSSDEHRIRIGVTGLRVVDVLVPLVDGGVCWILGGAHLGRAKLLEELKLRCARQRIAQTLVFPVSPDAAAEVVTGAAIRLPQDVEGSVRTLWPVCEHIELPEFAEIDALGTTRIMCGPRMPARGHWPAIDLLASRSRALAEALVEPAHVRLVEQVLDTLSWSETVRADALFDALAQARDYPAAIMRSIELSMDRFSQLDAEGRARLQVAESLERFFAQPLLVDGASEAEGPIDGERALIECRALLAKGASKGR